MAEAEGAPVETTEALVEAAEAAPVETAEAGTEPEAAAPVETAEAGTEAAEAAPVETAEAGTEVVQAQDPEPETGEAVPAAESMPADAVPPEPAAAVDGDAPPDGASEAVAADEIEIKFVIVPEGFSHLRRFAASISVADAKVQLEQDLRIPVANMKLVFGSEGARRAIHPP